MILIRISTNTLKDVNIPDSQVMRLAEISDQYLMFCIVLTYMIISCASKS